MPCRLHSAATRPPGAQVINEEIKDLIGGGDGGAEGAAPVGLPLRENAQGEVTVSGLSKHEVSTPQQQQQQQQFCPPPPDDAAEGRRCVYMTVTLCLASASTMYVRQQQQQQQ